MDEKYIFHSIVESTSPVRFGVEFDNMQYRLFSYFSVGNDSSIAVHSYFPGTHSVSKRLGAPPQELSLDERTMAISELVKGVKSEFPHKHTFHQSGILTAKNKKGIRVEEDQDIRSIPFSNITDSIRLCYFYPTIYSLYPNIVDNQGKHHNIFRPLGDNIKMPPIIEIRLSRIGFDLPGELRSAYPSFISFVDEDTLRAKDLIIFTIFRKSPNPHFPKDAEAFFIEQF